MKSAHVGRPGTLIGTLLEGTLLVGITLGVLLAPGRAAAEGKDKDGTASVSAADKDFVMEASCGGMAEVALGELAQPYWRSERSTREPCFCSVSFLTSALIVTWLPSMRTSMSSLRTPGTSALTV